MIAQLRGFLLDKRPPQLWLDVSGVGYEIDAPMSTFYQLPDNGSEVTLFTHFVVREDAHHLFGFCTRAERSLFRTLLKVNGVGPRLGLTILSGMSPDEFVSCILNNHANNLTQLPGVGKKTAERLVIEMRDKLHEWQPTTLTSSEKNISTHSRHQILQDAISALVALGYKSTEAHKSITHLDDGEASSEVLIRLALKEMRS